jgi:hypothetical protein
MADIIVDAVRKELGETFAVAALVCGAVFLMAGPASLWYGISSALQGGGHAPSAMEISSLPLGAILCVAGYGAIRLGLQSMRAAPRNSISVTPASVPQVSPDAWDELLALGFLKYARVQQTSEQWRALMNEDGLWASWGCKDTPWAYHPRGLYGTGRTFDLDAEELSEGSAPDYIMEDMKFLLQSNGVEIYNVTTEWDDGLPLIYLRINEKRVVLCDTEDGEETCENYSRHFFSIINRLLADTNSPERMYALEPFVNDQAGVVLTRELYDRLVAIGYGSHLHLMDIE